MIIVTLAYGFGNQLFWYATARALSDRTKQPVIFYSNQELVASSDEHVVSLHHLNIREYKIITNIDELNLSGDTLYINGRLTESDKIIIPKNYNIFFSNIWLGEKYFGYLEKELKRELKVKTEPSTVNLKMMEKIKKNNSVAVHVRPFLENKGTTVKVGHTGNKYYVNAIKIIKDNVPNPVFYIFCKDMDWCKKNISIDGNVEFVDLNNPVYEDFRLMYSCDHIISARSTLSWWASYMLENKNGIKIGPSSTHDCREIVVSRPPLGSISLEHDFIIQNSFY